MSKPVSIYCQVKKHRKVASFRVSPFIKGLGDLKKGALYKSNYSTTKKLGIGRRINEI